MAHRAVIAMSFEFLQVGSGVGCVVLRTTGRDAGSSLSADVSFVIPRLDSSGCIVCLCDKLQELEHVLYLEGSVLIQR
eukprot:scaffold12662_cov42-Cyclotella_meneghiniana.AAC.1